MRRTKMLLLPSANTLKSYTGKATGEVGITEMMKKRLQAELQCLTDMDKFVSVQIDEVALRAQEIYLKNYETYIGGVDYGGVLDATKAGSKLANKMLTFNVSGLAANYSSPFGVFLVKDLTSEQLLELTKYVVTELEKLGFFVFQLVTDNLSVNTRLFKLLNPNESTLKCEVPHPTDPSRTIHLCFDSSHIIKNIRNQFIDKNLKKKTTRTLISVTSSRCMKHKKTLFFAQFDTSAKNI